MDQTPNYQLNQWESTDRVLMEDFNADNAKLDAALKAEADARAAKDAALQTAVNAKAATSALTALASRVTALEKERICFGSFAGDATSGHTIQLPWAPTIVLVMGDVGGYGSLGFVFGSYFFEFSRGTGSQSQYGPYVQGSNLVIREATWYNAKNKTTYYIALR